MTVYNRANLKTFFETSDVPTGVDYSNFIDSCVNMGETALQTMAGPLNPTELISPRVSANNGVFTGTMRIDGITSANSISMFGILSANTINMFGDLINTGTVYGSAASFTANVSCDATIYSSAIRSGGFIGSTGIVSAAGVAQATAAPLSFVVNRGKGIADGSTTGFTPLTNRPGLTQYLFNEGVSANLWPPTGGFINGQAVNTAFALAASSFYTIVHLTASSYGVK